MLPISALALLLAAPLAGCAATTSRDAAGTPPAETPPQRSSPRAATSSAARPAPSAADSPRAARADSLVADVAVIRRPEGGSSVFVSFRSPAAVAVSPSQPLRVVTPAGTFEAPLVSVPAVAVQGDAVVTSAEYRLGEAGTVALDRAGNAARLGVHDGTAVRSVAVRRSDFLE